MTCINLGYLTVKQADGLTPGTKLRDRNGMEWNILDRNGERVKSESEIYKSEHETRYIYPYA